MTASGGTAHGENQAGDRIVARVGALTLTVDDVESDLAQMPAFQRAEYGTTTDEVRRRFLQEVLIPSALLSQRAADEKLQDRPPAAYRIDVALSGATVKTLRERIGDGSALPPDDVRAYYDRNRARYETPERILIWRILCRTRDEATQVLDAGKARPTPKGFMELARDHSLDKGSFLRGGELGFVAADGTTNDTDLRVDPALFKAAAAVHDGELVPTPIPEGPNFAVVWRRGTRPAVSRSLSAVAGEIREILRDEKLKSETDALVAQLRVAHLRDVNEAPLVTLELSGLPSRSDAGAP